MDPGSEGTGIPPSSNERGDSGSQKVDLDLATVLRVVRDFALECGGPRAMQAVAPDASLVADIGLGSLEQVELGLRLEQAFGVRLDEEALALDTPTELARAVREARAAEPELPPVEPIPVPVSTIHRAEGATTLHDALWRWADAEPLRPHVYLLQEAGSFRTLTYGELWAGAAGIAKGIRERGGGPGETVALMLPTGGDFLRTFMGILVAGAVPVPLYPPARMARIEDYLRRQSGILDNAEARLLVTDPEVMPVVRMLRGTLASGLTVSSAAELADQGGALTDLAGSPADPALIQYTSGSTGDPKGVLLSHGALIANIRAVAEHMNMGSGDVGVSWLPLYHDMGLIGTWLNCLYHGVPLALMSPLSFLARPERWLWTIHRFRATLSAAPNFGYELAVGKIPEERLEGLDLSTWRVALNGSEPVSPDTVERFCRRFERWGFRPEALMPAYGLAESAVALAMSPLGQLPGVDRISRGPFEMEGRAAPAPPAEAAPLRFVSVGSPLPDHELKIVDDEDRPLPSGRVGRLLFRGPSSMEGYYRRPDLTAEVVHAGGWIDTGDLGYRKDGGLYVTGRRKDLIIKAGRNLVPEEIEEMVASLEGIRKGCVAALGVTDPEVGTERLVIVAETRVTDAEDLRSLEGAVVRRISDAIDLPPDEVRLLPPRSIPKTSSGKIRRSTARQWLEEGRLGEREGPSLRMRFELLRGRLVRVAGSVSGRVRRGAYLVYLAVAATVSFCLALLPAWGVAAVLPGRRPARVLERWVSRIGLRLAGLRISVEGREHLPDEGPVILAANHSSYVDTPVLLGQLPLDFGIVAKSEVLEWPIVGTFVRKAEHPTVDRWDFRKSVEESGRIARRLATGESILFFPEGTFVRAAGLRAFRLGAFEVAVETGIPVIPLALSGTRRALPAGRALPRPGPIHLWIGPPVPPEGEGWSAAVALRDQVFEQIADHSGEPRLEMVAAGPLRPPSGPS